MKDDSKVLSKTTYSKSYEVIFFLLLFFNIFFLLSLITHSPSDDIWMNSSDGTNIENLGGKVGAILSEFPIAWLGYSAYLIPVIISFIAIRYYKIITTQGRISSLEPVYNLVGFLFLMLSVSGFLANNFTFIDNSGGWIGLILQQKLTILFGGLTNIVYISLIFISFSIAGRVSWFVFFDKTGRIIINIIKKIARSFIYIKSAFNKKRHASNIKKNRFNQIKSSTKKKDIEIREKQENITQSSDAKYGVQEQLFVKNEYILPSLSLLDPVSKQEEGYSKNTLDIMSKQVEVKLKDFGVNVSVEAVTPGPVVTQFELGLEPGVRAGEVIKLSKDLARALLVESVRIVDVIPGKPLIGLEIPNIKRELINLKEMLASDIFSRSKSVLTLALGKDINGNPIIADLAKMPHLLVAGATGMGKSVGLNAIIISILYKATIADVRFIMIDPKVVELASYADIPHLLTPVITDMEEAYSALRWSVNEMEKRYILLAKFGTRNIEGINAKIADSIKNNKPLLDTVTKNNEDIELTPLPFIVIIIDEYADMLVALAQKDRNKAKRVEWLIIRLAQKARAAGIHLVIATQRPSVDVITGLIKSNIPTRISFRVSSAIDSRTILDQSGAEQLLGMGDMLYITTGQNKLQRIHGVFVSDNEVMRIAQNFKAVKKPDYLTDIISTNDTTSSDEVSKKDTDGEKDSMYEEALEVVLQTNRASISSLQRRLRIGYNRAARIIEDMETAGVVSAMNTNGNRDILMPKKK